MGKMLANRLLEMFVFFFTLEFMHGLIQCSILVQQSYVDMNVIALMETITEWDF